MIEIIRVLMNYGVGFEYENRGSMGEKITSYETGIEVSNQQGKIYFQCAAPTEIYADNDSQYKVIAHKVENELIAQTSSF